MRERWLTAVLLAATLLGPVGAALFKVWVGQDAVQLGYRLSEREDDRRRLRNEVRQLEVELAFERSPARLADMARSLGLEPASPRQLLTAESARARLGSTETARLAGGGRHGRP